MGVSARVVRSSRRRLIAGFAGSLAAGATPFSRAAPVPPPPMIAAAANLRWAIDAIAKRFEAQGGGALNVVYGSSGMFVQQITQGAPYQLFLAADEGYAQALVRAGLTRGDGVVYARGGLALVVPRGSPIPVDPDLAGLRAALSKVRRFAIANPDHAPYGRAAREALRSAGLWDALGTRIVQAENVAAAAQWVQAGTADAGIVAYSLLAASELGAQLRYAMVSAKLHPPLRQRMVLMRDAGPVATAFYGFIGRPEAVEILRRHGFDPGT